jgi:hypothetical protein
LLAYMARTLDKGQPIRPWMIMLTSMSLIVGSVGLPSLAFLAANGGGEPFLDTLSDIFRRPLGLLEELLFVLVLGLLIVVPSALRSADLDMATASPQAQKALPRILATVTAVLTGLYILLLHFSGGPLRTIRPGPLVAGMIFTVLLLVPWYASIARTSWRQELSKIFDPKVLVRPLRQIIMEVWSASRNAFSHALYIDVITDQLAKHPIATETLTDEAGRDSASTNKMNDRENYGSGRDRLPFNE